MTQDDFKQSVDKEVEIRLKSNDTKNQYGVTETPYHTHNNVDSPSISFKGLSDTPKSYKDKERFIVVVNETESGLEYTDSLVVDDLEVTGDLLVQGDTTLVGNLSAGNAQFLAVTIGGYAPATRVYSGAVNSDGTAGTPFPTGWTSATPGTGNYTVTHNLSTTSYVVVAMGGTAREVQATRNANTIDFLTRNSAGTLADGSFTFILQVV